MPTSTAQLTAVDTPTNAGPAIIPTAKPRKPKLVKLAVAASSEPPDLLALLNAQEAAFLRDGPPSAATRRDQLKRLSRAVVAYQDRIVDAINTDFGSRSRHETAMAEILFTLESIKHNHSHLTGWMKPHKRKPNVLFQPSSAQVYYQPLGVIGIMSPWNYPASLVLTGLAAALAAGNRVMLKLSEHTPHTSALLAEMVGTLFTAEQVLAIQGDASVGVAFSKLPFDHLLFTGSTAIGRHVLRAAAEHLTPVTLELGGKSPAIIDISASMADAAGAVASGKLLNAGQTCIAPDYVMVPKGKAHDFAKAYTAVVRKMYPTLAANPDYTAIINAPQYQRLNAWVAQAEASGAHIQRINPAHEELPESGRKVAPTLAFHVSEQTPLGCEEIFGPVLVVVEYHTLDEAIAYVNARPRPLALYIFAKEQAAIDKVLQTTTSGGVTVNGCVLHFAQDDLPFGGVGASGIGAYHGQDGFRRLSHAKGVFRLPPINATPLLRPPYGVLVDTALPVLIRRATL
jgi:coniferyl-aldehyde dehydrogenase